MAEGSLQEKVEITAQDVINRLRLAAQPPGKKGLWLKDLSDKRLAEIYLRLKQKQPIYRIAKMVQIDWGLKKNSDIKTIGRGLRKFRERVFGEIQEAAANGEITKDEEKASVSRGKRIVEKLDVLGTLRWLIELQAERVEDLRNKEKASMPFKFTGKEIERLGNLGEQFLTLAMRLGAIDEKPSEINLNIKTSFDEMLKKLPDDGSRLVGMTTRFLEMVDKLAIPMKMVDGKYVKQEEKEGTEDDDDAQQE